VFVTLGVLAGGLLSSSAPALAATPETPVTKAPTLVTGNTATFNGELNPGASSETIFYRFAYTPGPSCANAEDKGRFNIPKSPAEASGNHIAVSATAENLVGSTKYTVCLVAGSSEFGFIFDEELASGSPVTFETPAAKPLIYHEDASGVTPFEARLEGVVNANNQSTTCKIEYGKTTGYGSEVPCKPETLEGGGEQSVGATVTGLQSATTYYYRIVAKNGTGATEGAGKFTTLTLEAPIVDSESVFGLSATGVTLGAQVNPNYQETTYAVEYATEGALIGTVGATTVAGTGPLPAESAELPAGVVVSDLTPGTTYYYRVTATNGTGTTTDSTVESFTTPVVPLVSTGEAQNITQTTATLSGTVNPMGVETTYYFEYVSQAGYEKALTGDAQENANPYAAGETTTPASAGASTEPQAVGPIPAGGLLPGTAYHYRLVAHSEFEGKLETSYGPDETFTTLPGTPPIVSTGGASAVSQNSATLSGTVSTNSLQTQYGFEIGTEPGNYGPATGLGAIGGAQTEEVHVTLGELQPGTTYYYRVTATNADGTVQGQPGVFTTPSFPTLLVAPTALPLIAYTSPAFPKEEKSSGTTTTTKTLTNKEKLAKALKVCKRDKSESKRAKCEKAAHKKYPAGKRKTKKK
jgi:hypothetical protein